MPPNIYFDIGFLADEGVDWLSEIPPSEQKNASLSVETFARVYPAG
jgi:hypothetical protein